MSQLRFPDRSPFPIDISSPAEHNEMDTEDFPTSPAKRQRTASPGGSRPDAQLPESLSTDATNDQVNEALQPDQELAEAVLSEAAVRQESAPKATSPNSLLDALMLQVEAESEPDPPPPPPRDPIPNSSDVLAVEDQEGGQ